MVQTVRVADGRSVAYAEWGDVQGVPVVELHGTPGSRLGRPPDEERIRELGIRWAQFRIPEAT
jgi:hypothetical protein